MVVATARHGTSATRRAIPAASHRRSHRRGRGTSGGPAGARRRSRCRCEPASVWRGLLPHMASDHTRRGGRPAAAAMRRRSTAATGMPERPRRCMAAWPAGCGTRSAAVS
eukprot:3093108-Prymnesium_polylepis.1